MNDENLDEYLRPGRYVDSDHPVVVEYARREAAGLTDPREIALKLFHAVRDGIRYDPYDIDTAPEGLTASRCISQGFGFCVTKAATLAAVLRVHGIPARLGFADVRNHLTSRRLRETMGTDLFVFHGYTDVMLDGRWIKATPAFNLSLCERAGTKPLDWDGRTDSIFHPFDDAGRRHMEYVLDRGTQADVPRDALLAAWREHYPPNVVWNRPEPHGDFEDEVEKQS
jgi:transglutaminase-like putative cysteine protease